MSGNPVRVLWKRLPTFFPNIKLQLVPLSEAATKQLLETGHLDEVVFKTTPNVSKAEIWEVLTKVYQIPVTSIRTAVYEGKKQRVGRRGVDHVKRPDYKKVWVSMLPGAVEQPVCPTESFPPELRSPAQVVTSPDARRR